MFYFSYDQGEFFVIREFKDSYDVEIVDIVQFYDIRKIYHWCKCADIEFPYELNDCVYRILSKINPEDDFRVSKENYSSFHKNVTNGNIKLY